MSPRRSAVRLFIASSIFTLALLAATPSSQGQGAGVGNTTSTPVAGVPHDYIAGLNETVNPANGALSIRIAQEKPHERGKNWPSYAFMYDSNNFSFLTYWATVPAGSSSFTYLEAISPLISYGNPGYVSYNMVHLTACQQNGQYTCTNFACDFYSGYLYTDLDGGKHGLGLQAAIPQTHNGGNDCQYFNVFSFYYGGDELYKASMDPTTLAVTVVDLHGNKVAAPLEDANGNYLDTTHRTAPLPALPTLQLSSQTYNYSKTYNILNNSADGTACQEGTSFTLTGTVNASETLTLPNGQQYTFQFDPVYGQINKIIYPTGATVTYTWSVIPLAEGVQYHQVINPSGSQGGTCSFQYDMYAITKRVVSFDGVTNAQEQDFSYSTNWPSAQSYQWTTKTTTVTTKDLIRGTNFNTIYTYSPVLPPAESAMPGEDLGYVPVEKTIQYYGTDGSLLKTTTKGWATMNTLAGQCETLPNGQTAGKFYTYQPYAPFAGLNPQPFNLQSLDTNLPTDVKEYDYGQVNNSCSTVTGLPVRETVTAYQTFAPTFSPYASLLDRPASVKVYGVVSGSQALLAETDYTYDGSTPSNVSPAPYGHDEAAFGSGSSIPRGNPTTVTKKCFVGATACTDSVTTYTYDTTGQVLTAKDANNNTTTYSYTDNYTTDDGSPSQNTNAFVTRITKPVTNGVSHITNFQYGFNDGKLRLVTDENNLQTKYCYWTSGCGGGSFDPFVRLTESDAPDGGQTNIAYSDAGPNPSVTTTKKMNGTQSIVSVSVSDGLGHKIQAKQCEDGPTCSQIIKADTTYDGMGLVRTQSNPYRSTSDPTYGLTTTNYDSLGRTVQLIPPDGTSSSNFVSTQYSNNCTTVTDQTFKARKSCTDGLGRLIEVDEPSNGNSTSASGTVTVGGGPDQSTTVSYVCGPNNQLCYRTVYDSGSVQVNVNGFLATATY